MLRGRCPALNAGRREKKRRRRARVYHGLRQLGRVLGDVGERGGGHTAQRGLRLLRRQHQ